MTQAIIETLRTGQIRWNCSGPDEGPDVGIEIGLPDGSTLYFGEISKALWSESDLGSVSEHDGGWWIVHWSHHGPVVLGRAADTVRHMDAVEGLAASIAKVMV